MTKNIVPFNRGQLLTNCQWPLLFLALGGVFFYLMFTLDLWMLWGIPPMKPVFADHYALLAAADCSQQGFDVFLQNPCDPYNRVHVYSRLWLLFSSFGVHANHNTIFGIAIICSFLLASTLSITPRNFTELLISALVIASPAVMLGVERGNSDLLMFSFCVAGVYFLSRKQICSQIFAYLLFTLAFFLKLYPIASFVLLIKNYKEQKKNLYSTAAAIVIVSLYVAITYNDLIMIQKNLPKPDDFFMTFGSQEIFKLFNIRTHIGLVTVTAILLTVGLGALFSKRIEQLNSTMDRRVFFLFLAGAANICLCFFINLNYHYRCVYFLCCLPYFFRLTESKKAPAIKIMAYALYSCILACTWAEFFIYWVGEPAVTSVIKVSFMEAMRDILILKHASSWGATLILLLFLAASLQSSFSEKFPLNFKPRSPDGLGQKP